jgi:ribonuclease PH
MQGEGLAERDPVNEPVAAVSVGIVDGVPFLDLDYREDSRAQVDMNVVATRGGGLVEVQGTAEGEPFARGDLDALLDLATAGLETLFAAQARALASS